MVTGGEEYVIFSCCCECDFLFELCGRVEIFAPDMQVGFAHLNML